MVRTVFTTTHTHTHLWSDVGPAFLIHQHSCIQRLTKRGLMVMNASWLLDELAEWFACLTIAFDSCGLYPNCVPKFLAIVATSKNTDGWWWLPRNSTLRKPLAGGHHEGSPLGSSLWKDPQWPAYAAARLRVTTMTGHGATIMSGHR